MHVLCPLSCETLPPIGKPLAFPPALNVDVSTQAPEELQEDPYMDLGLYPAVEEPVAEADRSMDQDEDSSEEDPSALPIGLALEDIQAKQEEDPDIRVVKAWKESKEHCPTKEERAPYHADVKYWCGLTYMLQSTG